MMEAPRSHQLLHERDGRRLLPPDLLRPIVLAVAMSDHGLSVRELKALALSCKTLLPLADDCVEVLHAPWVELKPGDYKVLERRWPHAAKCSGVESIKQARQDPQAQAPADQAVL